MLVFAPTGVGYGGGIGAVDRRRAHERDRNGGRCVDSHCRGDRGAARGLINLSPIRIERIPQRTAHGHYRVFAE